MKNIHLGVEDAGETPDAGRLGRSHNGQCTRLLSDEIPVQVRGDPPKFLGRFKCNFSVVGLRVSLKRRRSRFNPVRLHNAVRLV